MVLSVTNSKCVQKPCLKISLVCLWVQLTTGVDTTQRGSSKKIGYNKLHKLTVRSMNEIPVSVQSSELINRT